MVCFKHGPGCGCACKWITWDWRSQGDDGGTYEAGHPKLDLIGNATYKESGNGEGYIELPDNTSGIVTTEENPFTEFAHLAAILIQQANDSGGSTLAGLPSGVRYRLFFESDSARNNYRYCDLKLTDSVVYTSVEYGRQWVVELGVRVSGSDTLLDAWADVGGGNLSTTSVTLEDDWYLRGGDVFDLQRIACTSGIGPNGCAEGYAAHAFSARGSGFSTIGPGRWALSDPLPQYANTDLLGASIELALSSPAGQYCGIIRMDNTAAGANDLVPGVLAFKAGQAATRDLSPTLISTTWFEDDDCSTREISAHNICADPTYYRYDLDFDGLSGTVALPDLQYSSMGGSGYTLLNGGATKQFIIDVSLNLLSTPSGEEDWRSRGETNATLDVQVTIEHYEEVGILGLVKGYTYVWDEQVALGAGVRELDCDTWTLTLHTDDASVTTHGSPPFSQVDGEFTFDPVEYP